MLTVQCSKSKSEIANISSLIASKTGRPKKVIGRHKMDLHCAQDKRSNALRRPIKWSLIPIDINNKSSSSTVIRLTPKCKFRESADRFSGCCMHKEAETALLTDTNDPKITWQPSGFSNTAIALTYERRSVR
jgi:hypothetical protein